MITNYSLHVNEHQGTWHENVLVTNCSLTVRTCTEANNVNTDKTHVHILLSRDNMTKDCVFLRCMAAMLTFLSGSGTDATQSEITSSPLPWSFAITPTQGPHPDRQDKMSELLKSHDSFVLRKSPHTQISRPNRAILPNNDTMHPRFTQTIVQVPHIRRLQQKSVVFLLRKLAAIL